MRRPCLGAKNRPCPDNALVRDGSRCPRCARENVADRKAQGLTGHVGRHIPARTRAAVIAAQKERCARCLVSQRELRLKDPPESLEVHHRDGNTKNNLKANLVAYCPDCHHIVERERGR